MAQPELLTYYECVAVARDFLSGNSTTASQEDIRRVIHDAYREVGEAFGWSFLHRQGRVQLRAALSTGTVGYVHGTNGTSRVLTAASTSWPTWAADAVVRVGEVPCHVQTRTNSTSLVLDSTMNPGQDVDSETSYQIYPHYYHLGHDFAALISPWGENSYDRLEEVSYDRMMALDRYRESAASPDYFCVREVADLYGTFGLYIHPPSNVNETIDFIYQRRPRQLRYTGHDTAERVGTITVTAAGAVSGTSTTFNSLMEGSVMRIGLDGTNIPTGLDGLFPYSDQRIIKTVTDSTTITLDGTTTARSSVKYCITDPIDINISLANCLKACIFKRLAVQRNMKNKADFLAIYEMELRTAQQNDHRVRQPRVAGAGCGRRYRRRFANTPIGSDVT